MFDNSNNSHSNNNNNTNNNNNNNNDNNSNNSNNNNGNNNNNDNSKQHIHRSPDAGGRPSGRTAPPGRASVMLLCVCALLQLSLLVLVS